MTIKKAFHIAATGRPGPVVVDIPKDVTAQMCEFEYPKTIQMRSYNPVVKGPSRPDQEGGASCCRKPSVRSSIPAVA
jgi:thiamine pyrophosphate-dependent acetolactate synthase large subunit-like protein